MKMKTQFFLLSYLFAACGSNSNNSAVKNPIMTSYVEWSCEKVEYNRGFVKLSKRGASDFSIQVSPYPHVKNSFCKVSETDNVVECQYTRRFTYSLGAGYTDSIFNLKFFFNDGPKLLESDVSKVLVGITRDDHSKHLAAVTNNIWEKIFPPEDSEVGKEFFCQRL